METVLTKKQVKRFRAETPDSVIVAEVRYDDECGNGHNTFAITAEVYEPRVRRGEPTTKHSDGRTMWLSACGCCHEEVAKHFPQLAPLLKWHLTSSDGPMHYVGNTVYHAGDRDCWGLRKGEFRQHTSHGKQNGGVAGVPNWTLEVPKWEERDVYANEKPQAVTLEWVPCGTIGEGKKRDLAAARSCAVWPDATDEELTSPGLEERLKARLPALMEEFKKAVESLGFTY